MGCMRACSSSYVDVRDLGLAHVLAITKQEASGNRVIVSAGPYKWQDFGEYQSFNNLSCVALPRSRSRLQ